MREVVIAGYLRTAQSRSRPNDPARDWFCRMRGDELLAKLLPEVIQRTGIKPEEIDDFLVGCSTAVGEQWAYGGRFPLFLANLPETIPAKFLDQQCGSSMACIHTGFMEIAMGFSDIILAGGYEHMTRIPMGAYNTDKGLIAPNMTLFLYPSYKHWDMMTTVNMGLTAEKLFSQTKFTREEIEAEQADGTVMKVDKDQAVRTDVTLEGLAELKPSFKKDGVITPGNSSPLNAAASSMVLMSKETAKKKGIKPLATIRSIGYAGVDPTIMGVGPVPASKMAVAKIGLKPSDMDYWEINEAFSIVALNCIKELGLDPERVNVMGGGIAIGHALGATGIRLVGTLARILNEKKGRYGCANACVGGGQGVATVIEREVYGW
jgi:acetyl-CoA acyltransferase